jgi:hypothetical protein
MIHPVWCRWSSVVALLLVLAVGPAIAFTPFVDTNTELYYGHYGQTGSKGFFGPYDVDNGTVGNLAAANAWVGSGADVGSLVSGSNAAISSLAFSLSPGVHWLKASVQGTYQINVYDLGTAPGAAVAMSPGVWTQYLLTVPTPWVAIRYGKTLFHKANLFQFGQDRTSDHLLFEFHFGIHPDYFYDKQGNLKTADPAEASETDSLLTPEEGSVTPGYSGRGFTLSKGTADSPQFTFGVGLYPWKSPTRLPNMRGYSNNSDLNAVNTMNLLAYLQYSSTNLATGVGGMFVTSHIGPESARTNLERGSYAPVDWSASEGWIFFKYRGGRFYLNSEVDWYNSITRFQRSQDGQFSNTSPAAPLPGTFTDGSGRSRFAPYYIESWRFMAEAGFTLGPLLVRGLYTYIPGWDRRHGILIDRQPGILGEDQSSASVYFPYSMLMANVYGAGAGTYGGMFDASTWAVRLDYAMAANLALFSTFIKSDRLSHGYGWGYIRPDPVNFGQVDLADRGTFNIPSPAIPDNDLGWELTSGIKWMLWENWSFSLKFAYWKPGRWFNFACVDKAVLNWDVPTPGNRFGINPDRTIDSVMGWEIAFGAGF